MGSDPDPEGVLLTRTVLALYDRLSRHDRVVLAAAGLVLLAAVPIAALRTTLDMSFRPLFAHAPDVAAATAEFESRFGQSSGSQVAIVIERDRVLDGPFLMDLSRLTEQLRAVPSVVEVLSAARLPRPAWGIEGARGALMMEPVRLQAVDAAADRLARELLQGPALPVMADSGRSLLVLARLGVPLDDLDGRTDAIERIRAAVAAWRPAGVRLGYSGVSVVEAAYAAAVPAGMLRSLVLTSSAIVLVLLALFRQPAALLITLAGVTVALPVTIAGLALSGRPVTMLSSMAPTVILIVGVADAIHMLHRWQREGAVQRRGAVRRMAAAMACPCALTTLTTAAGFLALATARTAGIREFGIVAAAGVVVVYAANLVLVPALLHLVGARMHLPQPRSRPGPLTRFALIATHRPRVGLAAAAVLCAAAIAGVPRMRIDQRFNEELPPTHAVAAAQARVERTFGGFLGPDLEITRVDGHSILDGDALSRIASLHADLERVPGIDGVSSVTDLIPTHVAGAAARRGIESLRADPLMSYTTREVAHSSERTALRIRTGDIGTRAALALTDTVEARAARMLGSGFEARVAGQWWLAQLGMASLLRDMLVSFATAAVLVLPMLALALRSRRLLLVSLPPNLVPMVAALAFMGWTGMTLRIGTALVLAIALAIAVDDTTHLLARVREERLRGARPRSAMRRALVECGPAVIATTLVLLAGFGSMVTSQIAAIRDMGLVAAVALTAALAADLLVLPPLYLLAHPSRGLRSRRATATSFGGAGGPGPAGRFQVSANSSRAWQ